jgi:hypothetical protein
MFSNMIDFLLEARRSGLIAELNENHEEFTATMVRAMRRVEEIREQNLTAAAKAESVLSHSHHNSQVSPC